MRGGVVTFPPTLSYDGMHMTKVASTAKVVVAAKTKGCQRSQAMFRPPQLWRK